MLASMGKWQTQTDRMLLISNHHIALRGGELQHRFSSVAKLLVNDVHLIH